MFNCAVSRGRRPKAAGNPRKGIVRYRQPSRGWHFNAVPRRRENKNPGGGAAARLLPAQYRPREIRHRRWREVKPGRLASINAKTGPRRALPCEASRKLRKLLNGLARSISDSRARRTVAAGNELRLDDSAPSQAAEQATMAVRRKLCDARPYTDLETMRSRVAGERAKSAGTPTLLDLDGA